MVKVRRKYFLNTVGYFVTGIPVILGLFLLLQKTFFFYQDKYFVIGRTQVTGEML